MKILNVYKTLLMVVIASTANANPTQSVGAGNPTVDLQSVDQIKSTDPGESGAYRVCEYAYNIAEDDSRYWGFATAYLPVQNSRVCDQIKRGKTTLLDKSFSVVLLFHADGEGPMIAAHERYKELGHHLASNSLVVVSINRYPTQDFQAAHQFFKAVVNGHLSFLFDESPFKFSIKNSISVIGHSAGGRSVIEQADVIEDLGFDLVSVVLLAPTINNYKTITLNQVSFDGLIEGFLGMQVFYDNDKAAFGTKSKDLPMLTSIAVYDSIGQHPDHPDEFNATKNLIYMPYMVPSLQHYFQNEPATLSYINAFLQVYANNDQSFDHYLKYQIKPAAVANHALFQMHQGLSQLTVADFDHSSWDNTNTIGGYTYFGDGIAVASRQNSAVVDPFSPHYTGVLYLETAALAFAGAKRTITFKLPEALDLSGFGHLGFRVSQVYHPDKNPQGGAIDFSVCLSFDCDTGSIFLSQSGDSLGFPSIERYPEGINQPSEPIHTPAVDGQTKNTMKNYIFKLTDFDNTDLTQVAAITLDLTDLEENTILILDDIAFHPW